MDLIDINGHEIVFDKYPNGETMAPGAAINHAAASARGVYKNVKVTFKYETDQDLINLMFVRKHLGQQLVDLHISYMPYSRMDRAGDVGVFTLKTVCELINSLDFHTVIVQEPHSDVTPALLDRCACLYPTIALLPVVVAKIGFDRVWDYLFFPDAGAQKRYASVTGYKTAVGYKQRDFGTGQLLGKMETHGFTADPYTRGFVASNTEVLIVDDLCSKGGTFIMAVHALQKLGIGHIHLLVAHCENTMWDGQLLNYIDGLWCTDSILSLCGHPLQDKVHIYSQEAWM